MEGYKNRRDDTLTVNRVDSWISLSVRCVRTESDMPCLTQKKQSPVRQSFLVPLEDWYPAGEFTLLGIFSFSHDPADKILSKLEDAANSFK